MRVAAICLAVGLVLADSSVAVLALPAIYRGLDVALGDLHWVLTGFNIALASPRCRSRCSCAALRPAGRSSPASSCSRSRRSGARSRRASAASSACARSRRSAGRPWSSRRWCSSPLIASQRRAVAVWVAAGTVGAALGPAAGGVLTETISWRAVFAVQAPLALAALPFALGLRGTAEARAPSLAGC